MRFYYDRLLHYLSAHPKDLDYLLDDVPKRDLTRQREQTRHFMRIDEMNDRAKVLYGNPFFESEDVLTPEEKEDLFSAIQASLKDADRHAAPPQTKEFHHWEESGLEEKVNDFLCTHPQIAPFSIDVKWMNKQGFLVPGVTTDAIILSYTTAPNPQYQYQIDIFQNKSNQYSVEDILGNWKEEHPNHDLIDYQMKGSVMNPFSMIFLFGRMGHGHHHKSCYVVLSRKHRNR